eukprot:4494183-Karenia_brevis.AAC.1
MCIRDSPMHILESRLSRSISSPDIELKKTYDVVDVPGDGKCYMYCEMVSTLDNDALEEWQAISRYASGVPRSKHRYEKEKQMLATWSKEFLPTNFKSDDIDMQYIVQRSWECASGNYQMQLRDVPLMGRFLKASRTVHLSTKAWRSHGDVFGGDVRRVFGDGPNVDMVFTYLVDGAKQEHGHWQLLVLKKPQTIMMGPVVVPVKAMMGQVIV